jgi:hypothetical protein
MKNEGIFVILLCVFSGFSFPAYAVQTGEYAPHVFAKKSAMTTTLTLGHPVGGPNNAGGGRPRDLAQEKKGPPKPGPNDGGGGGKLMDLAQEKRPPIKGPNDGGGGGTNPK